MGFVEVGYITKLKQFQPVSFYIHLSNLNLTLKILDRQSKTIVHLMNREMYMLSHRYYLAFIFKMLTDSFH